MSRARRVVENAFGILANRFQVLQRDIKLPAEQVEKIAVTTCVLHNFINAVEGYADSSVDNENTHEYSFSNGNWRDQVCMTDIEAINSRPTKSAAKVRDNLSLYFNGAGRVAWQEDALQNFNF